MPNSHGQALIAWVDLNRFKLYETLQMPLPSDTETERTQNRGLANLDLDVPEYFSEYRSPAPSGDSPK